MIVLKGDVVRTSSDVTGEVTEVWGIARTFLRIQTDYRKIIIFESEVEEVVKRPTGKSPWGWR